MIISLKDVKKYINTTEADEVIEERICALERMIRKYTNNNFQRRGIRVDCPVIAQKLFAVHPYLDVGDTVEISQSIFNDGVYSIVEKDEEYITLHKKLMDENSVIVTKVEYPEDVRMGVVNLLKWDLENREKVGVQSETISRHSVTYFNMDGDNSTMGFPKSLLGFLKPYKKARF